MLITRYTQKLKDFSQKQQFNAEKRKLKRHTLSPVCFLYTQSALAYIAYEIKMSITYKAIAMF